MANAEVDVEMSRGTTLKFHGTLTPQAGQTFATPVTALRFVVKKTREYQDDGPPLFELDLGSGLTIVDQSTSSIDYSGEAEPEDTAGLLFRERRLFYYLELTEADGTVSKPVGGVITITPDASAPSE